MMASRLDVDAPPLVLIVEDEVLIAMEMEDRVRTLGYSVLGPAPSVAGANALLDTHSPQAALLDVSLRGESVAPIADRLLQQGTPFALVTGYARLALFEPALASAPRLSKPVRDSELATLLRQMLPQGHAG